MKCLTAVPGALEMDQAPSTVSELEREVGISPVVLNTAGTEQAAIPAAQRKPATRPRPVRVVSRQLADGQSCLDAPQSDVGDWMARLTEMFGSSSSQFALEQLQQMIQLAGHNVSANAKEMAVNSMLATIAGAQPQNEVEGVLAVQMATTHQLAMTLLARAERAEHIPVLESNGNMAIKLLRISREHAEAIAKLRRGGNQTVRVEHVHVHSGGQAIVGNVTHPGDGGTGSKTDDQPHAPGEENADTRFLTTESVAPLWSENSQREPVPVTRSERADKVPDARRREG